MIVTPRLDEKILVDKAVRDSAVALRTVLEAMERLDADALARPSRLPAWSRGHVLAHIDGAGNAAARQAEAAARGELVDFYDGGRAGRNAAIHAAAGRTVEEHTEALCRLATRLDDAWPGAGSPVWDAPTSYRDGPLSGVALLWWRETRIHLVDLQVTVGPGSWDDDLCLHLLDFLQPRLDSAGHVELVADDTPVRWSVNDDAATQSAPVVVQAALRDLVAWLAGREPEVMPVAVRADEPHELPELGPWPSLAAAPQDSGR
ncbi:maleylpyruvate isomerase family mycothiol-dependent enzyme [Georgenia halophila]|uniref:Maleylpyruvate isomerase family mycothiol-dependent enzyme n=1 Tax=Georgenia halophila TaxID=620889 RepID=A0ABP8LJM9_9MICO